MARDTIEYIKSGGGGSEVSLPKLSGGVLTDRCL
jgi:hypothetical protein